MVRTVGAVAGLLVGLVAALTRAQPGQPAAAPQSSSWRAAVKAALAFGHAEGKAAALARFTVLSAPMSKRGTEAELDQLDRLANSARDAFLLVQRFGSPFWAVAAQIRMGDAFWCQADKIVAIPPPRGLAPAPAYMDVLEGLVSPLRDEARRHWEQAAKESDASPFWGARARERLAGGSVPGC